MSGFCPVPHTRRDKIWLGLGMIAGGLLGNYFICKRNKAAQKGPLKEFSVVYTDRAWNLMSSPFQVCMREIDSILKEAYNADHTALIPGSGTYAMEAVARAFGQDKKCLVVRNGYFSFRWSDIFACSGIPEKEIVMKAQAQDSDKLCQYAPHPIQDVVAKIKSERPDVVFAPHVETAAGILLSDDYIRQMADAVHSYGGFLVIDAIAAGTYWIDMKDTGADIVISAPQKGWSAPACVGIVLMNERARQHVQNSPPSINSFCCNLLKWCTVMDKYTGGGFMYYTTLPTDALMQFREAMRETQAYGFAKAKKDAVVMGTRVRAVLEKAGYKSVAHKDWQSPTVVVSFTRDDNQLGKMVAHFKKAGLQIAGGVPLKIDEPFNGREVCFRLGLFGLDKFGNIDRTLSTFEKALSNIAKL